MCPMCNHHSLNDLWAPANAFHFLQFQHVFVAVYILNFSLVTANTSGHTKKMLTNCVILLGSTSGSLTGPQITKNVSLLSRCCPRTLFLFHFPSLCRYNASKVRP